MHLTSNQSHSLFVLLLVVLSALAFFAGREGPWLFDDKHNIVHLQNLQPEFLQTQPLWRGAQVNDEWHRRALSRLSFALSVKTCGLNTRCFKTHNIVIQGLTAIAVYFFALLLWRAARTQSVQWPTEGQKLFAFAVAAIWAVHPIQVSTVLYAVQRMSMLCTLFMICSLLCYVRWRLEAGFGKKWYLLLVSLVLAISAYFSKENAVVLPLLVLCIELFIFRGAFLASFAPRTRKLLSLGVVLAVLLLCVLGLAMLGSLNFFEDFSHRHFSPWERLLTQARVLWHYLYWIFLPLTSHYTLFHDDITVSQGLLQPWTTVFAVAALLGVSVLLWFIRNRLPLLAFAWFWFLSAHAVESTFLGLELVFEHRNHLPLVGLLFGVLATFFVYLQKQGLLLFAVPALILVYSLAITMEKSYQWRSDGSMLVYESRFHPQSVRLNYKVAFLWLQLAETADVDEAQHRGLMNKAEEAYNKAFNANSFNVHGPVGLLYMQGQGLLPKREETWQELYARLRDGPISADVPRILQVLVNCHLQENCQFELPKLRRAYEILLSRPISAASRHNAEGTLKRLRATNP